ncbi:MAG: hypothetical protein ABIS45_05985 [Burkholderiales bacterium]
MAGRLLILKAGFASNNNLIRSLMAGDSSLHIVGCHEDQFILKKSCAARNYLIPASAESELPHVLNRIIKNECIDLVIPNSDADVGTISSLRDALSCRVFLPRKEIIKLCQDKYALTTFLRRRGIPVPLTYRVNNLKQIDKLFFRFTLPDRLWCRIRKGTGSWGAIPVTSPEQARSWIKYWQEMRAIPPGSFTLSEYLPGRDFCFQGLWRKGKLILAKTHERLSYHVTGGNPSGTSSTAAVARMVFAPRVAEVCVKAIRALDRAASGVFFVDLKENVYGEPCVTEINAGRFANVPTIHDAAGKYNMAITYVRLALGKRVKSHGVCRFRDTCYVLRDIDMLPRVIRARELSQGFEDARGLGNGALIRG